MVDEGDGMVDKARKLVIDMWAVITGVPLPSSDLGDIPERVFEFLTEGDGSGLQGAVRGVPEVPRASGRGGNPVA
jgi:hypothetical protein